MEGLKPGTVAAHSEIKLKQNTETACNSFSLVSASKLLLMETFWLPLISYGCECVNQDGKKLCQLNVCWRNAYIKVFGMHYGNRWRNCSSSVKDWILDIYVPWRNFSLYISFLDFIMKWWKCAFFSYSQAAEFVSMYYDFDIAVNICTM